MLLLVWWMSLLNTQVSAPETDCLVSFSKIDNKVTISVNDSLVYDSGTVDFNQQLNNNLSVQLGNYLTKGRDKVIIRLYNGHEPYLKDEEDKHWEIEYQIIKNGVEIDLMWDMGDDNKKGLVFEEKYFL